MRFEDFRQTFAQSVVINRNQVLAWHPGFDKNNLGRWVNKGYLMRLRNGLYCFSERVGDPDIVYYAANQIYMPSYVSLHTALSFYGLIPESVGSITSVTGRKTNEFHNPLGQFSYQKLESSLMFGYDRKQFLRDRVFLLASPEKALLDLFYLYPFYSSTDDMLHLRMNQELLMELVGGQKLNDYCRRFKSNALHNRVINFRKTYDL